MAKKRKAAVKREGPGRPMGKEGKAVVVAASVPDPLAQALKEQAAQEQRGVSAIITDALRAYLKRKGRA